MDRRPQKKNFKQKKQETSRFRFHRNDPRHASNSRPQRTKNQVEPQDKKKLEDDQIPMVLEPIASDSKSTDSKSETRDVALEVPKNSPLDNEAEILFKNVHDSLTKAIDCSRKMPLSEHVLFSTYESYENMMTDQRKRLDSLMNKLYENAGTTSLDIVQKKPKVDFSTIDSLIDKYDLIYDFSELMFDRIGQNLDDAAGLLRKDAELVQATLKAAKLRDKKPSRVKVDREDVKKETPSTESIAKVPKISPDPPQFFSSFQNFMSSPEKLVHQYMYKQYFKNFNTRQLCAFKDLYAWRENLSRRLNETVSFVLPNNLMIRISEYLPREPQGVIALCNPTPPMVKKYLNDINAIILKALDVQIDETTKALSSNQLFIDPMLRSIDLDTIGAKYDMVQVTKGEKIEGPNLLDSLNGGNITDDSHNSSYNELYQHGRHLGSEPSRLYNFLDACWTRASCKNMSHKTNSSEHSADDKQFLSPYDRYMFCKKS